VTICSSDTNKNANKTDGWSELLGVISMGYENSAQKPGIKPRA
jgi:hypothetical protein